MADKPYTPNASERMTLIEALRHHAALMIAPEVKPAVRALLNDAAVVMADAADALSARSETPEKAPDWFYGTQADWENASKEVRRVKGELAQARWELSATSAERLTPHEPSELVKRVRAVSYADAFEVQKLEMKLDQREKQLIETQGQLIERNAELFEARGLLGAANNALGHQASLLSAKDRELSASSSGGVASPEEIERILAADPWLARLTGADSPLGIMVDLTQREAIAAGAQDAAANCAAHWRDLRRQLALRAVPLGDAARLHAEVLHVLEKLVPEDPAADSTEGKILSALAEAVERYEKSKFALPAARLNVCPECGDLETPMAKHCAREDCPCREAAASATHPQEVINYLNDCVEQQSSAWPLTKVQISKTVVDDIVKLLSARSASGLIPCRCSEGDRALCLDKNRCRKVETL